MPPPAPQQPRSFDLTAQQASDAFDPHLQPGQAIPDKMASLPPGYPPQGFQSPQHFMPEDARPDMRILWDQWQQRVASAIYARYSTLTNSAGYGRIRRPLACYIDYVVSRTGVVSAQITQPSPDLVYNTLCLGAVTSLSGQVALLQFPQGSQRMNVEQPASFTENVYPGVRGYKFPVNDGETVKMH
jgi:hypothetical protein